MPNGEHDEQEPVKIKTYKVSVPAPTKPIDIPGLLQEAIPATELAIRQGTAPGFLDDITTLRNFAVEQLSPPTPAPFRAAVKNLIFALTEPSLNRLLSGQLHDRFEWFQLDDKDRDAFIQLGFISDEVRQFVQEGFKRQAEMKALTDTPAILRPLVRLGRAFEETSEAAQAALMTPFQLIKERQGLLSIPETFKKLKEEAEEAGARGETLLTQDLPPYIKAIIGAAEDILTPSGVSVPTIDEVRKAYAEIPENFKARLRNELPPVTLFVLGDPLVYAGIGGFVGAGAGKFGPKALARGRAITEAKQAAQRAERGLVGELQVERNLFTREGAISSVDEVDKILKNPSKAQQEIQNFFETVRKRPKGDMISAILERPIRAANPQTFARIGDPTTRALFQQAKVGTQWRNAIVVAKMRLESLTKPFELEARKIGDQMHYFVKNVKVKAGIKKGLGDEEASFLYVDIKDFGLNKYILDPDQIAYLARYHNMIDGAIDAAKAEGVVVKRANLLKGQRYTPYEYMELPKEYVAAALHLRKPRKFQTGNRAAKSGFVADPNDVRIFEGVSTQAGRAVQEARIKAILQEADFIKTLQERVPHAIRVAASVATAELNVLKKAEQLIHRIGRGEVVPIQSIRSVERFHPQIANRIDEALTFQPERIQKILTQLKKRLGLETRILEAQPFPNFLAGIAPPEQIASRKLSLTNLNKIVKGVATNAQSRERLTVELFKDAAKARTVEQKSLLKEALEEVNELMPVVKQNARDARAALTRARQLAGTTPLEKYVDLPAFRNFIATKEVARGLEKALGPQRSRLLRGVFNVSRASVALQAGIDLGTMTIQFSIAAFRDMPTFVRSIEGMFAAVIQPKTHTRWMADNFDVAVDLVKYGGPLDALDYYQAIGRGGILRKPERLPWLFGDTYRFLMNNTLGRAEAGFTAGLNVLKIETWKGLRPILAKEGEEALRIGAEHIGLMSGTLSVDALGLSATHKTIEGALVAFSPRFTRSAMAIVAYAFRGGIRGELARDALLRLWIGAGALYYVTAKALGQNPEFNPMHPNFFTVEVDGIRVGPNLTARWVWRMAGEISQTLVEDPGGFLTFDMQRNGFLRTAKQRFVGAPGGSLALDILTGRTYLGAELNEPQDYAKLFTRRLLPFSLEGYLLPEEGRPPDPAFSIPIQFIGLSAWPKSLWVQVAELRERYAGEMFKDSDGTPKTWQDLTGEERLAVRERFKDLAVLEKQAQDALPEPRKEIEQKIDHFFDLGREAILQYEDLLWTLDQDFQKGGITGRELREGVASAATGLRGTMALREGMTAPGGAFEGVLDEIQAKRESELPEDLAFEEYMREIIAGDFFDAFAPSQVDYDAYNSAREAFRQRWGEEIYRSVIRRLGLGKKGVSDPDRRGIPDSVYLLWWAREILKPYWDIGDEIYAQYGFPSDVQRSINLAIQRGTIEERQRAEALDRDPRLRQARRLIRQRRQELLRREPRMEELIRLFYRN